MKPKRIANWLILSGLVPFLLYHQYIQTLLHPPSRRCLISTFVSRSLYGNHSHRSTQPSKRPSAAQLLCHERMQLAIKSAETQKMIDQLAVLRTTLQSRQEALQAREQELDQRDEQFLQRKEAEITTRIAAREEEITQIVLAREEELRNEMIAKEQATMQAVALREMELKQMWDEREKELRAEVEKRDAEILKREERLKAEAGRLDALRRELDARRKDLGMSAGEFGRSRHLTTLTATQDPLTLRLLLRIPQHPNLPSRPNQRSHQLVQVRVTPAGPHQSLHQSLLKVI